ncbi:MAG: type IV toxin-antitoxin system AbiEi family antitoxin, partial [Acidimicrobiales bacterium]
EQLELDQPLLVNRADLDEARTATGSSTTIRYLIDELTAEGWLLPLRTRGYWEFAPAARAGPIGAGDPYIELRATLRKRPTLPAALAAESAAWLHGFSARPPNRHVIAAPPGLRLPPALSDYRVIRFQPELSPETNNGLPVWRVPTLLVAMSHRPASYRDWPNVSDWLRQATAEATEDDLRIELADEPRSTWMRLAYLLDRGDQAALAHRVEAAAPAGRGPYYLGSRDRRGRHNSRYDVIDSVLEEFAE